MNLNDLGLPSYWNKLSDDGVLRVTLVLPTGRATESGNGHIALATDGLYLSEIAIALNTLSERAGLEAQIRALLDIDFLEDDSSSEEPSDDNLIVSGSAGVNAVASLLLDRTQSFEHFGGGFTKPYSIPHIAGIDGKLYTYTTGVNTGALALYANPWSRKPRIAVLCAGLLAVGTAAAQKLALEYLAGNGDDNNRTDRDQPLKIVDGVPRKYRKIDVREIGECLPPMDIASITGLTIRE